MLTIPRSLVKSSTKDLSFPISEIVIQRTHCHGRIRRDSGRRNFMMLGPPKAEAYRYSRHIGKGEYRRFPAWILT
jgi:hypothetical protein